MPATNDAPTGRGREANLQLLREISGRGSQVVSGPNNIFICDECVFLCLQITSEHGGLHERAAYFSFVFVVKLLYPFALFFHRREDSR